MVATFDLAVIRSGDIHVAVKFYELLGLQFELHRYGEGAMHYASGDTGVVCE